MHRTLLFFLENVPRTFMKAQILVTVFREEITEGSEVYRSLIYLYISSKATVLNHDFVDNMCS